MNIYLIKIIAIFSAIFIVPLSSLYAYGDLEKEKAKVFSDLPEGEFLGSFLKLYRFASLHTLDDVILKKEEFFRSNQKIPRFGYTSDDIWASVEVNNDSGKQKKVYFEFHGPIEFVEGFLTIDDKLVQHSRAGMYIPLIDEESQPFHVYPTLVFSVPSGKSVIYFSEKAVAPHYPVRAYSEGSFNVLRNESNQEVSVFLGCCLIMAAFIVFLFFSREIILALLLALSFLGFFGLYGFITGMFRVVSATFFINTSYVEIYRFWIVFLSLYLFFLQLFSIKFSGYDSFRENKATAVTVVLGLTGQIMLAFLSLFNPVLAMNVFGASFNLVMFALIYVSFKRYRAGSSEEMFSLIGWLVFAFSGSAQLAYFFSLSENTFFAFWGTAVGFMFAITLLGFSVLDRIRRSLQERINLKERLAETQRENLIQAQRGQVERAIASTTARIVHDIKTPFSALKTIFQALRAGNLKTESLERIAGQIDATIRYVDELLANLLHPPSANKNLETVAIKPMVEEIVKSYIKNPALQVEVNINIEGVSAQAIQIRRLLTNLIVNAMEAQKQGRIWIKAEKSDENTIAIIVGNDSAFIPQDRLQTLFQEYNTHGKKYGTGLGLIVCKEIVTSLDGQIACFSDSSFGTEFRITLPALA